MLISDNYNLINYTSPILYKKNRAAENKGLDSSNVDVATVTSTTYGLNNEVPGELSCMGLVFKDTI